MLFKEKMKKKNSSVKEQAQMSNYMLYYLTSLNLKFSIQYLSCVSYFNFFLFCYLLLQLFFNFNFNYFIIIKRFHIQNKLLNNKNTSFPLNA